MPSLYHALAPLAGVSLLGLAGPAAAADKKPNVLVILTDDQGYADLSCQGSPDLRTPNIDRIAKEGVRCTHAYVTAPQCGPSRAGIMTGMLQNRFGYRDNNQNRGLPAYPETPTMAETLRDAGYRTMMIGKWHIGPEDREARKSGAKPSSDIGEADMPWQRGFDQVVMHEGGGSHFFPYSPAGEAYNRQRGRDHRLLEVRGRGEPRQFIDGLPEKTYLTDYFSERAVAFIEDEADQPWFIYLAYNAPHTPIMAPEADLEANNHIADKTRRTYAAMLTAVDRGVGNIYAALEKSGELENTLVFFLSDNGAPPENAGSNTPWRGLKGDMFEGGIRIPFLVSWPAVLPRGKTYDPLVSSLDIYPTAAAAAGVPLHQKLDGVNLVPFLTGQESGQPHPLHFVMWRQAYVGVADSRYKVIRNNQQPKAQRYKEVEKLPKDANFDLQDNPGEDFARELKATDLPEGLVDRIESWRERVAQEAKIQPGAAGNPPSNP
jgi:arylsulfatase A-like enzyme